MGNKKTASILMALIVLHFLKPLQAQESESPKLPDILQVLIRAEVQHKNGKPIWSMENTTYTVSGRDVQLNMEGEGIRILSHLTPYSLDRNGSLMLFAKGEVWLSIKGEDKYYSGMVSVPVHLGEKAYFFPLGVATDNGDQKYTIKVQIIVDKYDFKGK